MPCEYEKKIINFWKEQRIYEKVKAKNSNGEPFYLVDGPPYANGHIHMGTALNKILKDVAIRSKRLMGKDVFDKPGYDTHGLPIEFQVEKEIGSRSKNDIEKYGIKNFIDKCRKYATEHIDVMNEEFFDIGVWMDWGKEYKTLDTKYIETIWGVLKKAYEKDLLYLGKYPVHVCTRCATAVAYNEIEYSRQKDKSIFVKFPLMRKKNIYLIIWTTTPWTLPANTGIMIHPEIIYSEIETAENEKWIIANNLVDKCMNYFSINYKILRNFPGKDIVNLEYDNPLSKHIQLKLKKNRKVVSAPRYVTTEEGTGLVHCAPGHGKEDYEVGIENDLDVISLVEANGMFKKESGKYFGKFARVVDNEIIDDLKKDGFLVFEHDYDHDYPFCWRCKTPLIIISKPQWFLKISKIKKELLKQNEKVEWIPSWGKMRMKAWLEGISDWPISRERYWGTPLPIWVCKKCEKIKVIENVKEIEKLSGRKINDIHKPEIDEIKIKCSCGGEMSRIPEVFDVWFDSGVASWASLDDEKKIKKYWPADLNIEGADQFRGWWNSQLILSQIEFGEKPFKSICVHGMVLDIKKRKMSKSTGNSVSPTDVIAKYGRDYLRYYLIKFSKGEDFSYDEKEFIEIKKVITILTNIHSYLNQIEIGVQHKKIEDKWIISRLANTINEVQKNYNSYRFYYVIDILEKFIVEDVSRTYIQITRERSHETYNIISEIIISIIKMFSPIIPFFCENMWQELRTKKIVSEESVFLSEWPKFKKTNYLPKIEEEFNIALKIIERGLAERDKIKMGVRWPLLDATYYSNKEISKEIEKIISKQINVKNLFNKIINEPNDIKVKLNTEITPELESEGFAREIVRQIQSERKKRGLQKNNKINLEICVSTKLSNLLDKQKNFISERTGANKIVIKTSGKSENYIDIKNEKIGLSFEIIN